MFAMRLSWLLALGPAMLFSRVAALDMAYCSTQNTGSDNSAGQNTFNSDGLCKNACDAKYAFAIVQASSCWCSNFIPQQQEDPSKCNSGCPGYPSDTCGNQAENLYGYIRLDKADQGTQIVSSAAPSTTAASSSTSSMPTTQTVVQTVTQPPSSTSATSTTSSSISSSTFTPTPTTGIQTLTVSGNAVTQTVTGMSTPAAALTSKKHPSSGTIAGAVVGASVAGGLIVAGLAFYFRRRRRSRQQEEVLSSTPQRNPSTASQNGLLSTQQKVPAIRTEMIRQSIFAADTDSPMSASSDRRNSRMMIYDQRLNPMAMHDNYSRTSVITMEDNKDYGRKLNVRNPDPERQP